MIAAKGMRNQGHYLLPSPKPRKFQEEVRGENKSGHFPPPPQLLLYPVFSPKLSKSPFPNRNQAVSPVPGAFPFPSGGKGRHYSSRGRNATLSGNSVTLKQQEITWV